MIPKHIWVGVLFGSLLSCSKPGHEFPDLNPCESPPTPFSVTKNVGPDFDTWQLSADENENHSFAIIYAGNNPDSWHPDSAKTQSGSLLRNPTIWRTWKSDGSYHSEALIQYKHDRNSQGLDLHAYARSKDFSELNSLQKWMNDLVMCKEDAV